MSGVVLAIVIALAGLSITVFWFGVSRRRKAEAKIGIQSLAGMKWRDCVGVVLESLARDGYRLTAESTAGDGGEVMLRQNDSRILLGYKHGTAYRLGDANVREFANQIRIRGALKGILLTLGSADELATNLAATSNVQLIEGPEVWQRVRPFIPPEMMDSVQRQAAAEIRTGLWTGALASVVVASAVFLYSDDRVAADPAPVVLADEVAPVSPGEPASTPAVSTSQPASDAAMLRQLNATAAALAEVEKLTEQQLMARRADTVRQISLIGDVDNAAWSAPKTMVVVLSRTDGKDKGLVDEICRLVTQHEEMRFTRLQLQSPADSGLAVRWRLCE